MTFYNFYMLFIFFKIKLHILYNFFARVAEPLKPYSWFFLLLIWMKRYFIYLFCVLSLSLALFSIFIVDMSEFVFIEIKWDFSPFILNSFFISYFLSNWSYQNILYALMILFMVFCFCYTILMTYKINPNFIYLVLALFASFLFRFIKVFCKEDDVYFNLSFFKVVRRLSYEEKLSIFNHIKADLVVTYPQIEDIDFLELWEEKREIQSLNDKGKIALFIVNYFDSIITPEISQNDWIGFFYIAIIFGAIFVIQLLSNYISSRGVAVPRVAGDNALDLGPDAADFGMERSNLYPLRFAFLLGFALQIYYDYKFAWPKRLLASSNFLFVMDELCDFNDPNDLRFSSNRIIKNHILSFALTNSRLSAKFGYIYDLDFYETSWYKTLYYWGNFLLWFIALYLDLVVF